MPPRKLKDEFGPGLAGDVHAACLATAPRVARALARALGAPCQVAVGRSDTLGPGERATGPGLIVLLPVGHRAAVVLMSESSGLLPAWYDRPNATQAGKLSALAQELGKTLLPRKFSARDCAAAAVADLDAALLRAACAPQAARIELTLAVEGRDPAAAWLVWPVDDPSSVFDPAGPPASGSTAGANDPTNRAASPRGSIGRKPPEHDPPLRAGTPRDTTASYRRGLLRVRVPLSVTLAGGRQAVGRVMQIAPGAILRFDKSCDASLDLEAGGRRIGQGICVQIGSRLGLLVTSPTAPADGGPADGSRARS